MHAATIASSRRAMKGRFMISKLGGIAAVVVWLGAALACAADPVHAPPAEAPHVTETMRGRVVWLAEALQRRYGIETDADAAEWNVAFETEQGRLWPIVKDARGRGFRLDDRLRNIDLEVLARRFEHAPVIQLVQVYRLRDGRKYELDYWCDICSIPMYELKECECCQGPIRIRERLVEEVAASEN